MDAAARGDLHAQIVNICCATAFLVSGLTACGIAAIRRRAGVRVFLWLGIWSSAYGLMHLMGASIIVETLPQRVQAVIPFVNMAMGYLLVIVGSMAWLDLIQGMLRRFVIAMIVAASVTAVLGIVAYFITGRVDKFMPLNNLIAACVLAFLIVAVSNRRMFERYLLLPDRRILVFGTFIFAAEALLVNLLRPLGWKTPLLLDHLGFACLLAAFGYSALRMVLTNEHRLLSIESELEVARGIQSSILPSDVPQVRGARIAAAYQPATSVAGDFYEFIPVDDEHVGIFIADVCGHGVPAALIASMLKVAVQSAAPCADDPSEFLAALNRTLAAPLRGQLVSAAYLWMDAALGIARYSAAGHPPLLHWRNERPEFVESNGLLFGVLAQTDYPSRELALRPGDRLLLYTDGISEPENAAGVSFGEARLPALFAGNGSDPAGFARSVLAEIPRWQSLPTQQDDMTLIVVDVGEKGTH